MYKDCVISILCNLGFYGKVLARYKDENNEEITFKFILNKNKSVIGNIVDPNGIIIGSLDFNTIKELTIYLEKNMYKIYCIEVA